MNADATQAAWLMEELYGRAWRALAAKEGHQRGLPPSMNAPVAWGNDADTQGRRRRAAAARRREIFRMHGAGMTHAEIARRVGITRGRVSQILGEAAR